MRMENHQAVLGLDPKLAQVLARKPRPDDQVAYIYTKASRRLNKRGVIAAPSSLLDEWEASPNGVSVAERFGRYDEEPNLAKCLGLDTGVSLIHAVDLAIKKPRVVSPLLANLCRVAHQDPRNLLKLR